MTQTEYLLIAHSYSHLTKVCAKCVHAWHFVFRNKTKDTRCKIQHELCRIALNNPPLIPSLPEVEDISHGAKCPNYKHLKIKKPINNQTTIPID